MDFTPAADNMKKSEESVPDYERIFKEEALHNTGQSPRSKNNTFDIAQSEDSDFYRNFERYSQEHDLVENSS